MFKKAITIFLILLIILTTGTSYIIFAEEINILKNPDFEETASGIVNGWNTELFIPSEDAVKVVLESEGAYSGESSYAIINKKPNDSKIYQDIRIEPGKVYRVSSMIKTEGIKQQSGSANITLLQGRAIYTSKELKDTGDEWQKLEFSIRAEENLGDMFRIMLRLGGQGVLNEGKVSFDDVSVVLIEEPDSSMLIESFYVPPLEDGKASGRAGDGQNADGGSGNKTLIYIGVGILIIGGVIFLEMKFSSKKSDNDNDNEKDDDDDDEYDDEYLVE